MEAETRARKGEVIKTVIGGGHCCIEPPLTKYHRVVDERGHGGFNGRKTVVETDYDDYKQNGVSR